MKKILVEDLKEIEYGKAWDLQEHLLKVGVDAKLKASRAGEPLPDLQNYLLLCQHPHVYTLGKHGKPEHLLWNTRQMEEGHVSFYQTNRGGDITYHGPGQLVAYPILDLEQFFTDLRRYMRTLEEAIILTLAEYGIKGDRLEGSTGVWLDPDDPLKARKICAMGVRCSRWITIHGLALNINSDLSYFDHIVPCGIADKGVTGMNKELGHDLDETEVQKIFTQKFSEVFEAELHENTNPLLPQVERSLS